MATPARPQRSTREKQNWPHLLDNGEDEWGEDGALDKDEFAFDWDNYIVLFLCIYGSGVWNCEQLEINHHIATDGCILCLHYICEGT